MTGTYAPDSAQGKDGDFYFNSVTFEIYNKVSGSWQKIANLGGSGSQSTYTLTLTSESDCGELSGNGTFMSGTWVTIKAEPYSIYEFEGWYNGSTLVSQNAEYSFSMPAENVLYEAKYAARQDLAPFSFIAGEDYCIVTGVTNPSVTELVVPDCVTEIREMAFINCKSLVSLTLPIADQQMSYLFSVSVPTSLKTIILSEGVTTIAPEAFKDFSYITDIYFPSTLTRIGKNAFSGCTALQNYHITDLASFCELYAESSLLWTGDNLYLNGELVTELVVPDGVFSLGNAFAFYERLTSVTMPNSVVNIGYEAFRGCSYLKSIKFSENLMAIGACAFYSCTRLSDVELPRTVRSIGERAFQECSSLRNIVIPEGVTSIALWAFYYSGLRSIVIPKSVVYIGDAAFSSNSSLGSVYYGGSQAEWEAITIKTSNMDLTNSTIYYYSETQPTEAGNYWHYDVDGVTPVIW